MASLFLGLQAQTQYKTYDANDANLDTEVNVGDVEHVATHAVKEDPGRNVVTAINANDILLELIDSFQGLGQVLEALQAVDERLSAMEDFYGIERKDQGHAYVDLGVTVDGKPLYWATTNLGASSPADYGKQYAWGETVGYEQHGNDQHQFSWLTYTQLSEGDEWKMTKYCLHDFCGQVDGKSQLEPEDDAAHMGWQGAWRMPTLDEFKALREQCDWKQEKMKNSKGEEVPGYLVSNKQDPRKFIFLPIIETFEDWSPMAITEGDYWTSNINEHQSNQAYYYLLSFDERGYGSDVASRFYGMFIRPVRTSGF